MIDTIKCFDGEYAFLSNFYECKVEWEGIIYPSTEHAFQAAKVINPATRMAIAAAPTPGKAKRMGRQVQLRGDWEQVKDGIMYEIVLAKFQQNRELADKLLDTECAVLEEGNTWNDTYWGVCNGVGRNQLGKTLMAVRMHMLLEHALENDLAN
jgi:ribA/ribD-fused uncharacterized protein